MLICRNIQSEKKYSYSYLLQSNKFLVVEVLLQFGLRALARLIILTLMKNRGMLAFNQVFDYFVN